MEIDQGKRALVRGTAAGLFAAGITGRIDAVAAMQPTAPPTLAAQLRGRGDGASHGLLLPADYGGADRPPRPATADALTRAWHQARFAALFAVLVPQKVQSVLLRNVGNTAYFTGIAVFAGERPWAALKNRDDPAPWAYHPRHYRAILDGSWVAGGREYFDFPHAAGGFPDRGEVRAGPPVDLFADLLEGLRAKGIQGGRLGIDGELYPSELAKVSAALPGVEIVNIAAAIRTLRIVKTPEELALYARAYLFNDRAQAFARDYLLTYGTGITDLELSTVTQFWMADELHRALNLAGGQPNVGAGTIVSVKIRTGRNTGVSAPNQPFYQRFGPGQSTQLASVVRIDGCGGEVYRVLLTAERNGRHDPHALRLWEASRRSCDIQRDRQVAGTPANLIAKAIYDDLVAAGLQRHIYHRPAHGLGSDGHYPPYIALGDDTVLPLGSALSQEPGLYDPVRGIGCNWSDTVVTGQRSGYRLSRVPYSRDWNLLTL